jgi:hypothetical protein
MSCTSEARRVSKSSRQSGGRFVAPSIFLAGGLLTAAWLLALILLVRELVIAIF